MNSLFIQVGVAVVFIGLLVGLTDPFMYWMPDMAALVVLVVAAALSATWVGFVALEQRGDEREAGHRQFAGRAAYLSGIAILTIALVVQGLAHVIDSWISMALGAMVVVKLVARWFADRFY
ncbi:MAG: hypothetical protein G01um10148_544 [Parcubacteria group bacterium Gr01-1014_8]|nr:MAG: hypothetical protein G01um10148_544 [Parcubacteria group bacterium Gr01-1014_8]